MEVSLSHAYEILERTPATLQELLAGLPDDWSRADEGPDTWSPFDVVGHLIHGERTDWMARLRIILEQGEERPFTPFDRFAQLQANHGRTLGDLLVEFAELRTRSLEELRELDLKPDDFARRGRHPELGVVTLGQLLATWVVHEIGRAHV